jgi:hypothetical protein
METEEAKKTKEEEPKYQLYSSTAFKKDYKRYLNNKEKLAKIDNYQITKNWRSCTTTSCNESALFNRKLQRAFRVPYRAQFTHYLVAV